MIQDGDRNKVIKLLGMLTSDFDGERATAAAFIARMAAQYKITVPQLCCLAASLSEEPPKSTAPPPQDRRRHTSSMPDDDFEDVGCELLKELRAADGHPSLTSWEANFVQDVSQKYKSDEDLSPKQRAIVERICAKIRNS